MLCNCGCGNETAFDRKKNKFNCFINGHNPIKHGGNVHHKQTAEYRAYMNAKARCINPKANCYHLYGGRGIEFRLACFEDFLKDVGKRPGPGYSLDRIDNDGHYELGNLKWATRKEQRANQRTVRALQSFSTEELIKELEGRKEIGTGRCFRVTLLTYTPETQTCPY